MATIKNTDDIAKVRRAAQTAAGILDYLTPHIKAGITTGEIDRLTRERIAELGIRSATVGYGHPPFPGAICTSINHVVCHGMPSDKKLKDGDIVNLDITIEQDGWFGDTSRMFIIGKPSILARRLVDTTYECMWKGIRAVKPGATLGDIGHAIQTHAEAAGFSVVRDYCGHGIGQVMHEDPQILHYGKPGTGQTLVKGMVFTIEPMLNAGKHHTSLLGDQWTVVTKDRSLSAQWEHQLIVTDDGYEVLSTSPGMPEPPTE